MDLMALMTWTTTWCQKYVEVFGLHAKVMPINWASYLMKKPMNAINI